MTPGEQELAFSLVRVPARGSAIGPDEFLAVVGVEDGASWALEALRDAIAREDADDAEAAMVVGDVFGFDHRWSESLVALLESDWHVLHESAAEELGRVGGPEAVPALLRATSVVPGHLEHDGGRALAGKAAHSLGRIAGEEAFAALESLVAGPDEVLGATARRVLERRRSS